MNIYGLDFTQHITHEQINYLLPAGRIVVLEDELRSHPQPAVGTSVRNDLHLGQPAFGSLVRIVELIGAVQQQAGMAILNQPIVQPQRWCDFLRSILAPSQIPLGASLNLQLDGRVITNLLFGNICNG